MRLIVFLLALCSCVRWDRYDTFAQATVGVSLAADYVQTRQIVRDGYEANPIIGSRGQNVRPEIYFPAVFVLHTVICVVVPRPWRTIAQAGTVIAESVTVWNNYIDGYRFEF